MIQLIQRGLKDLSRQVSANTRNHFPERRRQPVGTSASLAPVDGGNLTGSLSEICDALRLGGEVFLSGPDLAKRWHCLVKTLSNKRSKGEGIPWIHIGGLVRYRLSDVLAYEAEQLSGTPHVEDGQ